MWLVMYGYGRLLRTATSPRGRTLLTSFADRTGADAFVQKCRNEGMRASEPQKVSRARQKAEEL